MKNFGFVILGAGNIGNQFCHAVSLIDHCKVLAVASKSIDRARKFADNNGIEKFYDSYEEMLDREKPDCAYIAVTPNDHYRLTMMCLDRDIPVLCEKAMFRNSEEANEVFKRSREKNIFVMEALWSRFLPAVQKAKQWVSEGVIGRTELVQFSIGFIAPQENDNRYYNPGLGGGVAKDITVYAYQLTTYIINERIKKMTAAASWSASGVDITNHVSIQFEHTLADLMSSFVSRMEERMVIYGTEGKIVLPCPHFSSECYLYDNVGNTKEHFVDKKTDNGFVYEIEDAIQCIKDGRYESSIVPQSDTLKCSELFDMISGSRNP